MTLGKEGRAEKETEKMGMEEKEGRQLEREEGREEGEKGKWSTRLLRTQQDTPRNPVITNRRKNDKRRVCFHLHAPSVTLETRANVWRGGQGEIEFLRR